MVLTCVLQYQFLPQWLHIMVSGFWLIVLTFILRVNQIWSSKSKIIKRCPRYSRDTVSQLKASFKADKINLESLWNRRIFYNPGIVLLCAKEMNLMTPIIFYSLSWVYFEVMAVDIILLISQLQSKTSIKLNYFIKS